MDCTSKLNDCDQVSGSINGSVGIPCFGYLFFFSFLVQLEALTSLFPTVFGHVLQGLIGPKLS